ncbi:MAG TPA: coproporphyrinogen III oxidase, partial [Sphingorhabdus sp.]|nr:coproporphyrinogen III oxidase [Sphingorhabdus sp.]
MEAAGLPAYEISNHAAPGQESRHNLAYWRYQDYLGVGPGAHGRRTGMATQRHRKPENFLSAIERNAYGLQSETALDASTQAMEALLMGLRLREGVDIAALADRFAMDSG